MPCRTAVQIWQRFAVIFAARGKHRVFLHRVTVTSSAARLPASCLKREEGGWPTRAACPEATVGPWLMCPVCPESGKLCRQTEGLRAFTHRPTAQPSLCSRGFRAGAVYGAGSKHGEHDCVNAWSLNRHHFLGSYMLPFLGEQHTDKQCACQFWETKENETISCWVAQPLLWFSNKKICRNFLPLTAKWWISQLGSKVYWEHLNMWRKEGVWEPGFSQRWEMLHIQKIKTIWKNGDCKVSASWRPLKVTLLVLFCSHCFPDLICPSVMDLWSCPMTPPVSFKPQKLHGSCKS